MSKKRYNWHINYKPTVCFKEKLIKTVKDMPCFVISYDKSLNNILPEEQMDVLVRFWVYK